METAGPSGTDRRGLTAAGPLPVFTGFPFKPMAPRDSLRGAWKRVKIAARRLVFAPAAWQNAISAARALRTRAGPKTGIFRSGRENRIAGPLPCVRPGAVRARVCPGSRAAALTGPLPRGILSGLPAGTQTDRETGMNRRILTVGVVLAVLCAGGFFGIDRMEKKTEQAVRDALSTFDLTAEEVRFELLAGRLSLGRVAYSGEQGNVRNSITMDGVVVEGFNPACLDAGREDVPLVADSLVLSGIVGKVRFPEGELDFRIHEERAEGWRQNLGRLVELYRREPQGEAVWAEAYRGRLDMLACRGLEAVSRGGSFPGAVRTKIGVMGLMGPVDGSGGLPRLSLFVNNLDMDWEGVASTCLDRLEIRDALPPPPARMARLAQLTEKLNGRKASSPEFAADMAEVKRLLRDACATELPYRSVLLQNYVMKPHREGLEEFRLGELEHTLTAGTPFLLDLRFRDWLWRGGKADREPVLPGAAKNGLPVDGSLNFSLSPASVGPSFAEWTLEAPGLGRAGGRFDLSVDVPSLKDLLDRSELLPTRVLIRAAEAFYEDRGGVAVLLTAMGRDEDLTPLQVRDRLLESLSDPAEVKALGPEGSELIRALETMLTRPGTLKASCRLSSPQPMGLVFLMAVLGPDVFLTGEGREMDLSFTAEPGSGSLEEYFSVTER